VRAVLFAKPKTIWLRFALLKQNGKGKRSVFFFFFFFFFFSVLDFALQVLWNLKICADLVSCTVGSVFFLQAVNNQAILCLNFMQLSV